MMLLKVQLLNSRKRSQHTRGENGMRGICYVELLWACGSVAHM